MQRTSYQASNCTIGATLRLLGEKWTLLIVRESFFGATRFEQFMAVLGCPRNLLSERLGKLVDEGILERSEYREPGSRARHEYRLTPTGKELMPILMALMQWGDRHVGGPDGPPIVVEHVGCGAPLRLAMTCADGHVVTSPDEGAIVPGPGALPAVPA
ncbi:winged helix-turn-helix transcriptional regulator [Patulibacter minatonensis]|uniref:winged helix-turn-helix transcriptional regulator n=1 Tax=Patulibacter minatonensis TaxID=298163 RepID=UPI00047B2401|nr:helix-turn-helix domain-containing protein [Patulibacter minatonensis]